MPEVRYRSLLADSARWEGFCFRDNDIVISTPPKCGTTWMQMICALLIFQAPELDRPLAQISPWLDTQLKPRDEILALLEAQQHRRFIKTHTPLDGLPVDPRVTYIGMGRDPRDAGLSWAHHASNTNMENLLLLRIQTTGADDLAELRPETPFILPDSEVEHFLYWVDDESPSQQTPGSLQLTVHHLSTFWEARHRSNVMLLHYADLEADLAGEMRRLAQRLGIDVAPEQWPALVEAATFTRMRDRATEMIPHSGDEILVDARRFFFWGRSGQWRSVLDEEHLRRYNTRITELAPPPELAAWLHRDTLAVE